jgi:hypothetical protein
MEAEMRFMANYCALSLRKHAPRRESGSMMKIELLIMILLKNFTSTSLSLGWQNFT